MNIPKWYITFTMATPDIYAHTLGHIYPCGHGKTIKCKYITQSIYNGCIYWLYALADFAYKCTYLLQDKNDKDVVSVRHVQRQTVESVVIALIKRNLVERRDLNNVVFIESVGKFTSGKTNFQKAERYVCIMQLFELDIIGFVYKLLVLSLLTNLSITGKLRAYIHTSSKYVPVLHVVNISRISA